MCLNPNVWVPVIRLLVKGMPTLPKFWLTATDEDSLSLNPTFDAVEVKL